MNSALRIYFLPLLFLAFVFVSGCLSPTVENNTFAVASIHPLALIGSAFVNTSELIPASTNPHLWEPKPSSIERLKEAKFYLRVGMGFEGWERTLPLPSNLTLADYEDEPIPANPHIWLDPVAVRAYAEALSKKLEILHILSSNESQSKLNIFEAELSNIDEEIKKQAAGCNITYVAYVPILSYFSRHYGLNEAAVVVRQGEPPLKHYEEVKELMLKKHIKFIVTSKLVNNDVTKKLAYETNATIIYIDPLGANVTSYPQLIKNVWEDIYTKVCLRR